MLGADILFTAVGMMAQFLMVWIAWEIRKGRKTLERQNEILSRQNDILSRSKA